MESDKVSKLTDALLEQIPVGVILADTNGDMVYINRTAEKIRRIKREDLLGKNVLDCHTDISKPNITRAVANIFSKPRYPL